MKNAIIVHGRPTKEIYYSPDHPSSSNFAWIPWLQKQLLIYDIKADTPEMPYAFEPDYEIWKKEFERFDTTSETLLIGHSAGGGFLLRWLSENKHVVVKKLVLVAPSIDPHKRTGLDFYNFELDTALVDRAGSVLVIGSDNDTEENVHESIVLLRKNLPNIVYKEFSGYGHFIPQDMGTNEFFELLEVLL